MMEKLISVIDAAKKIGKRKQHIFKVLKRLGIATAKQRHSGYGNQEIAYITIEEFNRVAEHITAGQNSVETANAGTSNKINLTDQGVFYLIQLEPDHDPGRFKVGFAVSMPERLRALRCSAPFAKIVETWPCRRLWEQTAIDCIAADCDRLHTEVFRTDSIEKVRNKCNQFFILMPEIRKTKK